MKIIKLFVYRDGEWKPVTKAEEKVADGFTGMDALVSASGHVFIRNAIGQYDRWRGVAHKPGDEPK